MPNRTLKNSTPSKKVNNGVRELRMPAMALLICTWALENKNAGIPLPVRPTITR